MENENYNNYIEEQDNTTIYENNVNTDDEYKNTENQIETNQSIEENIVMENNTTQETTTENIIENYSDEKLDLIHQDLGFICSFLILFCLVILLKYSYKFFDMFFKI